MIKPAHTAHLTWTDGKAVLTGVGEQGPFRAEISLKAVALLVIQGIQTLLSGGWL